MLLDETDSFGKAGKCNTKNQLGKKHLDEQGLDGSFPTIGRDLGESVAIKRSTSADGSAKDARERATNVEAKVRVKVDYHTRQNKETER